MWLYDTGEQQAIHIEDIDKTTVLDAFIHPLKAIRAVGFNRNGRICNEINGGHVAATEITTKRLHKETSKKTA